MQRFASRLCFKRWDIEYSCIATLTRRWLVNGAIGIVLSISVNLVMVQFDHTSEPYDVELVTSRLSQMSGFVTGLCHRDSCANSQRKFSFQAHGHITVTVELLQLHGSFFIPL